MENRNGDKDGDEDDEEGDRRRRNRNSDHDCSNKKLLEFIDFGGKINEELSMKKKAREIAVLNFLRPLVELLCD